MAGLFTYYKAKLYRYRFLILWLAFLLDFLTPRTGIEGVFDSVFHFVTYIFSILAGVLVLMARRKLFVLLVAVGIGTIILRGFNIINDDNVVRQISQLLQIFFYAIVIYEIFIELIDFSKVDLNTIGAAMAGFFIIGLLGGIVFTLMEFSSPGSFIGLELKSDLHSQLQYFSFINLTTIGFGDISPSTEIAQRVTVLFGLIGNFYTTIIIGIILSKFLANKRTA